MPTKVTHNGEPVKAAQPATVKPAPAPAQAAPKPSAPALGKIVEGHEDKGGTQHITKEEVVAAQNPITVQHERVATVVYGLGATVNLGNYENVRPFVQIHLPCDPDKRDEAFEEAYAWVDERLNGMVSAMRAAASNKVAE